MIYSWSKFNYGHTITTTNKYIPFQEGSGPELLAEVAVGNYSLGEFAQVVEDAMNAAGDLAYTVAVNRAANTLTISATGAFKLLTFSSMVKTTAFTLMGFNFPTADVTGFATYTGNSQSGFEYRPQFKLQSYVAPENFVESVEAAINQSADGRVEVVRFGTAQKIDMDIQFITNKPMDNLIFKNNANGLQAARDFMNYITQKKRFEFVPDVDAPGTYYKIILEKSPDYGDGTGFKLKERIGDGLPDFYDTGVLTMRVIA